MTTVCVKPATRVPFRTLCTIAHTTFDADPTMSDSEWKAAIKDQLTAANFVIPWPHDLSRAMGAIERLWERDHDPRPVVLPHAPVPPPPPVPPPLSRTEATAILRCLPVVPAMKAMPAARVLSEDEEDRVRAFAIQVQAIAEQVQRCKAAEQAPQRRRKR